MEEVHLRQIFYNHLPKLESLSIGGSKYAENVCSALPTNRYKSLSIRHYGTKFPCTSPWLFMIKTLFDYLRRGASSLQKLNLEANYYSGDIRDDSEYPHPFEHILQQIFTLCPMLEDLRIVLEGHYNKFATENTTLGTVQHLRKMELVIPSNYRNWVQLWILNGSFPNLQTFTWDLALFRVMEGCELDDKEWRSQTTYDTMAANLALDDGQMAMACECRRIRNWKMMCQVFQKSRFEKWMVSQYCLEAEITFIKFICC